MNKKIVASVLFLVISGMMPAMTALAADNTWTQTDWSNGGDGGIGATHPANQTGWNKFSSVTRTSGAASPGNVVLSTSNYSATDDGFLSTSGSATGGKFPNGTRVNSTVSGTGVGASVALSGTAEAGDSFDSDIPSIPAGVFGGTFDATIAGGTMIRNGDDDEIYVLQVNNSYHEGDGFFKFSISHKSWTTLAPVSGVAGGFLIRNGSDNDIFLFSSDGGTSKYSISSNTWKILQGAPSTYSALSVTRNGGDDAVYMLTGSTSIYSDTIFRYSIAGNTWTRLAAAPAAFGAGAKMIRNGNDNEIYALQGNGSSGFFKYSITADTWTTLAAARGPVIIGTSMIRNGSDNDIYVLPGRDAGFFRYSISGNNWTTLAIPPESYRGTMIRHGSDDDIYAIPGVSSKSFFKYSISGNSWKELATAPGRLGDGPTLLRNGTEDEIYVLQGGDDVGFFIYSISGNTWSGSSTGTTSVPFDVATGGTMLHKGDDLYVLQGGGFYNYVNGLRGFQKYSISSNSWTKLADVPGQVDGASNVISNGTDNEIYLLQGGVLLNSDNAAQVTGLFRYSIFSNSWTPLAKLPVPRGAGSTMIRNGADNDIYVTAGGNTTGFFKYSISANSWTTLAAVPGKVFVGATMIRNGNDNEIYVLQGLDSEVSGVGNHFLKYSISANTWTPLASLPGNIGQGASMIRNGADDDIYVMRGGLRDGFYRYSIAGNSWTTLAAPPSAAFEGPSMIRNGSDNSIYFLAGGLVGTAFYRYSISGNSWTKLANVPTQVRYASKMIRNGGDNTIFILAGGPFLWRYSINGVATHPSLGTFTSAVIDVDTHGATAFGNISWSRVLPPGTTLTLATRSGATPTPDGTWSAFGPELTNSAGSAITSPVRRFIQYRATFGTTDPSNTATLNAVTIRYSTRSPSGNLISSSYDTTQANNAIGGLSWTEGVTLPAGTSVIVSLRAAQTAAGLIGPWTDFRSTTTGCSKSSGTVTCAASAIPVPLTDGGDNRFVQYKVTEATTNTATPVVERVVLTYFTTAEQPPNTLIDTRPSGRVNTTSAAFTFHATESGSTFQCKLDGGSFASCSSPKNYTGLVEGPHEFQVRATDAGGHTDLTPTTARWTIDITPPNTLIDTRPTGTVHSSSATITFHATLTTATFQCKLDAGSYASCTSPKSYSGLANGTHVFQVRSIDSVGNTDLTPAQATWTVSLP